LYKQLSVFTEVLTLIGRAYVEETSVEDLLAGAMDGATDALDPFSTYIPESAVEDYMQRGGAGIERSGLTIIKQRGIALAAAVEANSPSASAGIFRCDVLTEINSKTTRGLPLWAIQNILAGDPGTKVDLKVHRPGETQNISITLEDFAGARPSLSTRREAAVLSIGRFAGGVDLDVGELLGDLVSNGEDKLIIDLRGHAGGGYESAYEIARHFVRGELGNLQEKGDSVKQYSSSTTPLWAGKLMVLVDRSSIGPSEVLATILRQGAGAQLVGERTFGYAGRLSLLALDDGSKLLATDGFYTGPSGEPIDSSIVPDVVVSNADRRFAEPEIPLDDLILDRALELIQSDQGTAEKKAA
jgi:carboxyl-terminal processing protease